MPTAAPQAVFLPIIAQAISAGALLGVALKNSYPNRHQGWSKLPNLIVVGLVLGFWIARKILSSSQIGTIVRSPRDTLLPKLSKADIGRLSYPPDALPGARDVNSPYGVLRVYEWGPEEGRKILLIHGISTPCIALGTRASKIFMNAMLTSWQGGLAHGLVEKGCRVMLLDLWGRGYSDTPLSVPHSTGLLTTSILLALASSPLTWTGSNTFSLIGYSFGGGIVANFTFCFPMLVSSLILIAPSGLQRPYHMSWTSKFLYSSGWIPESWLEYLVKRRLKAGVAAEPVSDSTKAKTSVEEELPKQEESRGFNASLMSKGRPGITVASVVAWQIDSHQGFIKAFMSSIRHGPIHNQHSDWRKIGERLTLQKAVGDEDSGAAGLQNGKVLIILGEKDPIIIVEEMVEDATQVLGLENVRFEICDAGHELPITESAKVVDLIWSFWEMRKGADPGPSE